MHSCFYRYTCRRNEMGSFSVCARALMCMCEKEDVGVFLCCVEIGFDREVG